MDSKNSLHLDLKHMITSNYLLQEFVFFFSLENSYIFKFLNCRFFFDFSATYVGVGMICPHIVNISLLIGGILSWGIMWPLIETRKGHWYSAALDPTDMQSLKGYQVCMPSSCYQETSLLNFLILFCNRFS